MLFALIVSGAMLAQSLPSGGAPAGSAPTTGPQSPQWSSLSIKQKLIYDARHMFDIDHVFLAGVGAAFDQERAEPGEWGEGWGPFAERYASHLGQYAVQQSIEFPVQAIDREDPRYFRSSRTSFGGRVGDAFLHTIWRHDDSGGMMPAYSEFFGDYGAAAVSRRWWPERFHTKSAIFFTGSDTLLIDVGINLFHEFAPDIKRRLHLSR